jgi:hypothetical protein
MDETKVETRHKGYLEKLREKETVYDNRRDGRTAESSNRAVEDTDGTIAAAFGSRETSGGSGEDAGGTTQRENGYAGAAPEGIQGGQGVDGRFVQGIRSANPASQYPATGHDRVDQSNGTTKLTVELTEEEKAEKEREQARQRKQRQRDKEKLEASQGNLSSNRDSDRDFPVTPNFAGSHNDVTQSRFHLRNPIKLPGGKPPEPVKLLTKTEAEDFRDALIDLFCKGSSLLDDVLEIIVKGHEPVQIWEMDKDDAAIFVDAHLKRAQKEQDAARTARVLLRIYDKFHTFNYLFTRSKATVTHVKDHGGLSFR